MKLDPLEETYLKTLLNILLGRCSGSVEDAYVQQNIATTLKRLAEGGT